MRRTRPIRGAIAGLAGAALLTLTACAAESSSASTVAETENTTSDTTSSDTTSSDTGDSTFDLGAVGDWSSTEVHTISIDVDTAALETALGTYVSTGDKEWVEATVTVDGVVYEHSGIRLKGNSTLRGVSTTSDPTTLPWLVDLDQFGDDATSDDDASQMSFVVRANTSVTALNEAVALELLDLAGLASQDAIAASFSVNGSDAVLRLVIDDPDDAWVDEDLGDSDTDTLYKAETGGDWSYRGDDASSYEDVFDVEAGEDDHAPLTEFLQFVNDSDDATFAAELDQWLDVDSFATYLAMQELLDNFDDIDGPGNNAYLHYDAETGVMTVVPWDYNLAFGQSPGGGAGGGAAGGGAGGPGAGEPGGGGAPSGAPAGGGGPSGGSNVLVERFLGVEEWQSLVDSRLAELQSSLVDSGDAAEILAQWQATVISSGLVDEATVTSEGAAIAASLT